MVSRRGILVSSYPGIVQKLSNRDPWKLISLRLPIETEKYFRIAKLNLPRPDWMPSSFKMEGWSLGTTTPKNKGRGYLQFLAFRRYTRMLPKFD